MEEDVLKTQRPQITQEDLTQYIASLPDIGESQRRHFRGYARMIVGKLASNGLTHADVPAPAELIKLRLFPKGKRLHTRRFSALGFFAKFLASSGRWRDEELTHFAELMGRARGRTSIAQYVLPALDSEISGMAFRQIRCLLGWSSSGACLALGISAGELQRIEAKDTSFPDIARPALADVLNLARRLPTEPPPWIKSWNRFSKPAAMIPFSVPPCPGCGSNLATTGKEETRNRGYYWSFSCRGCGGKYWSNDGNLRLVIPGRGWKRVQIDHPVCPGCNVECSVIGSPGSSNQQHYFECPECKQHYRMRKDKPVLTTPFVGPRVKLPFLPDRTCPNCTRGRLRIRLRPPRTKQYLFNCRGEGSCGRSFKWNEKLKKPVLLKQRMGAKRVPKQPGRKPDQRKKARITLAALFLLDGIKPYAMKTELFPEQNLSTHAFDSTKKLLRRSAAQIEAEKQRLSLVPTSERLLVAQKARQLLSLELRSLRQSA